MRMFAVGVSDILDFLVAPRFLRLGRDCPRQTGFSGPGIEVGGC